MFLSNLQGIICVMENDELKDGNRDKHILKSIDKIKNHLRSLIYKVRVRLKSKLRIKDTFLNFKLFKSIDSIIIL